MGEKLEIISKVHLSLYFAPKATKSLGYTSRYGSYWAGGSSNVGYLAIYEIATGNSMDAKTYEHSFGSLNYNKLREYGKYDSLWCHRGNMLRNDEVVIYKEDQCTIKYLIEISM